MASKMGEIESVEALFDKLDPEASRRVKALFYGGTGRASLQLSVISYLIVAIEIVGQAWLN